MEGCDTHGTFCSELMGIVQQTTARDIQDRDLEILDAFWLGMVPKSLDNIICNHIHKNRLLNFTQNIQACNAMAIDLTKAWSEVKELLMAKAIGLHRIINHISKLKETQFRKNINKQNAPVIHIPKDIKPPATIKRTLTCEDHDPKRLKEIHDTPEKNRTTKVSPTINLCLCKGITCNKNNSRWCLDLNYNANKIEGHRKHCVRCSKFCTVMKQWAEHLDKYRKSTI